MTFTPTPANIVIGVQHFWHLFFCEKTEGTVVLTHHTNDNSEMNLCGVTERFNSSEGLSPQLGTPIMTTSTDDTDGTPRSFGGKSKDNNATRSPSLLNPISADEWKKSSFRHWRSGVLCPDLKFDEKRDKQMKELRAGFNLVRMAANVRYFVILAKANLAADLGH